MRGPGGPDAAVWETRHAPYLRCSRTAQRTWEDFQAERARARKGEKRRQEEARVYVAGLRRRQEAEAAAARNDDAAVNAHVGDAAAESPPVRVFGKQLRDGRSFALYLIPRRGDPWSHQALALIQGRIVTEPFGLVVRPPRASPVPGLPHVLSVPLTTGTGKGAGSAGEVAVGITDNEARAIECTSRAWDRRQADALRAAAPGAPTWKIKHEPEALWVGMVMWDVHARTHAVVLAVSRHWQDGDGRSFGLTTEDGWLYAATVRAALPQEMTASPCHCTDPTGPCPRPDAQT